MKRFTLSLALLLTLALSSCKDLFQDYLEHQATIHESQISCDTKKIDIDAKFTTFGNRAACRALLEVINVLDNDMKLKIIEMMKNRRVIS